MLVVVVRGTLDLELAPRALIVLANRPSIADATQLLAFGATACLSKGTRGATS